MHEAVERNSREVAEVLIEHGANVQKLCYKVRNANRNDESNIVCCMLE